MPAVSTAAPATIRAVPPARPAAAERAAHDLCSAECSGEPSCSAGDDVAPAARLPGVDGDADPSSRSRGDENDGDHRDPQSARKQNTGGCAEAGRDADPVPSAHRSGVY